MECVTYLLEFLSETITLFFPHKKIHRWIWIKICNSKEVILLYHFFKKYWLWSHTWHLAKLQAWCKKKKTHVFPMIKVLERYGQKFYANLVFLIKHDWNDISVSIFHKAKFPHQWFARIKILNWKNIIFKLIFSRKQL